jgi:hypothetical protein
MATGYTRQSSAFIITGATVEASHHNNEYNAIETAFHASTGHNHDGTAGAGAPIPPAGLSGLSSNGIAARVSSTAFAARTLTGTSNRITITNGTGVSGDPTFDIGTDVVTLTGTQTLTNKTLTSPTINTPTLVVNDDSFTVRDNDDTTKVLAFQCSGITTGTTRTLTVPNASGTIALTSDLTSGYQPLDADLTNVAALSSSGFISRNNTGPAMAVRTLTGTSNRITITNGTGTGGDPVFDIGTDVVTLTGSQTLTNKTLTSPIIGTISNTGTLTLPTSTDTLVGRATTDTLTNKTLTSPTINTPTLAVNDDSLTIRDNSDTTKVLAFQCSGISTGTTRTLTVPNASGTIALTSDLTSGYQPLDTDLTNLAAMSGSGIVVRNSTGPAIVQRTITAGSGITVSNGNGVSDNPTIALNVNGLTAETTIDGANDTVPIYDNSESANNKATVNSLNKGYVFLESVTASSSASVTFTTSLTSTYDTYLIIFENVKPATDNAGLGLRVGTGVGPTWVTGANYDWGLTIPSGTGVGNDNRAATAGNDTFIGLTGVTVGIGNDTGECGSGRIEFSNPDGSDIQMFSVMSRYVGSDGQFRTAIGGGRYAAAAITGVQLFFTTGNIASGTFRLYGLRNS